MGCICLTRVFRKNTTLGDIARNVADGNEENNYWLWPSICLQWNTDICITRYLHQADLSIKISWTESILATYTISIKVLL